METTEQFMQTNHEQQLEAIKPLLDQIQQLLAQGQHPDASARIKPEAKAKYDPYMADIPAHIIKCAQDIQKWFGQQGIKEWAFLNIQSRSFDEAMEATAQPKPSGSEGGALVFTSKIRHIEGAGDWIGPFTMAGPEPFTGQVISVNGELRTVRSIERGRDSFGVFLHAKPALEATAQQLPEGVTAKVGKTALAEAADWFAQERQRIMSLAGLDSAVIGAAEQFLRWETACREADEQ